MKAKVKATGRIIDIDDNYSIIEYLRHIYTDKSTSNKYHENELEFIQEHIEDIDWETRRYEIAKAMLPVIYLDDGQAERADDSDMGFEYKSDRHCAKEAVDFADALIEELKKRK